MMQIIFEGLILGLSSGAYCLGACLVFFMPYLLVEGKLKIFENLSKVLLFMLGRLIAYIGFALIVGFIGKAYHDIFTAKLSHTIMIAASLLMLIYALTHNRSESKSCGFFLQRFKLIRIPFFLGLFSGLNPCPPFLVAVTRLWTIGDIFGGVILFLGFFLGTSFYMVPLVFVSYLNRFERIKRIGFIIALLSGLWFLLMGILGLFS